MPLILAQNEATESGHAYADVFGRSYEFPRRYRSLLTPGERFIYYRGRRRAGGGVQPQVYLGAGVIGETALKSNGLYECSILDFHAFPVAVGFKPNGTYLESAAARYGRRAGLHFRAGVRAISEMEYTSILRVAGIDAGSWGRA